MTDKLPPQQPDVLAEHRAGIETLREDAERFRWFFSDVEKSAFVMKWLEGVPEKWSLDLWRSAIDSVRCLDRG